ncbi:chaperonin 10-like protein [Phakopsora pachyrhizi]|nr:chaperonin 10-like protein [Phakopsora pachyrhizi]
MLTSGHYLNSAALSEESGKNLDLQPWKYKPQKWCEDYVDIKIINTSICGSCIHTLSNGWPSPTSYPAICGHEIVGRVVKAGTNTSHRIGDRVGIGAQSGSCGSCELCKADLDQFCEKGMVLTYQGKWPDGTVAQGGFSNYIRVHGKFAIPIPKDMPSDIAAPLMCAGITTYSPIKKGAGPGKKVAVVGIGGLGHLGIQWSIALGSETYALSRSESKKKDAVKMGLNPENYIVTSDREATVKKWSSKFDLILCTSSEANLPLEDLYFPLLRSQGKLTLVGLPEEKIPAISAHSLVIKEISFGGSFIGSPALIKEMLEVAVKHKVQAWTTTHPMSEVSQKVKDMRDGKALYRYVMVN